MRDRCRTEAARNARSEMLPSDHPGCENAGLMTDDPLSEVRAFLRDHIESHEQLEALLLTYRAPRVWSAEEVAQALRLSPESADATLRHLVGQHLLASAGGEARGYRCAPGTPELAARVAALAAARVEQPLAILEIMSSQAIERMRRSALQTFAEAFKLRRPGRG
jgi:hypothetical protein